MEKYQEKYLYDKAFYFWMENEDFIRAEVNQFLSENRLEIKSQVEKELPMIDRVRLKIHELSNDVLKFKVGRSSFSELTDGFYYRFALLFKSNGNRVPGDMCSIKFKYRFEDTEDGNIAATLIVDHFDVKNTHPDTTSLALKMTARLNQFLAKHLHKAKGHFKFREQQVILQNIVSNAIDNILDTDFLLSDASYDITTIRNNDHAHMEVTMNLKVEGLAVDLSNVDAVVDFLDDELPTSSFAEVDAYSTFTLYIDRDQGQIKKLRFHTVDTQLVDNFLPAALSADKKRMITRVMEREFNDIFEGLLHNAFMNNATAFASLKNE